MPGILDQLGQMQSAGLMGPTRQPLQMDPAAQGFHPGPGGVLGKSLVPQLGTKLDPQTMMLPMPRVNSRQLEVMVNPRMRDIRDMAGSYSGARFRTLSDTEGNRYVWDASMGTHYDFFDGVRAAGQEGNTRFFGGENQDYGVRDMPGLGFK